MKFSEEAPDFKFIKDEAYLEEKEIKAVVEVSKNRFLLLEQKPRRAILLFNRSTERIE